MSTITKQLDTHCTLHWWNMGTKTLSFDGNLRDLLSQQNIKFTKKKTITSGIFTFSFSSIHGIKFKTNGLISDFPFIAKQFIQMELVRMGDKSQLYVQGVWRPNVNVNF